MIKIIKATTKHCELLEKIGSTSFLDSHGKSASNEDISSYIKINFSKSTFLNELKNPENIYHLIYYKNEIAGYSKIVLNVPNDNLAEENVTKFDRLYLLKEFYSKNLGMELFHYNLKLSKETNQKGMWLAVWIKNERAINFYSKLGFKITGNYDFKISENHSNPNHIMYIKY